MNNQRRKRISQSIKTLQKAKEELVGIIEKEKVQIKATPESEEDLSNALEEIVENLEETVSNLEEALDTLGGADF